MSRIGIGLGANMGEPREMIGTALRELERALPLRSMRVSPYFGSTPVGPVSQPDFVNVVCVGECSLAPEEVLDTLLTLETRLGRVRTVDWGPRIIDLDLLFVGDVRCQTPSLTLPHPEIPHRGFVLAPLVSVLPDWVHPELGIRGEQLLSNWRAGEKDADNGLWLLDLERPGA